MGKIGIMGGTFDPIHNGHLMLGEQAHREYDLDEVWFMPSGHPPHKEEDRVTVPALRLAMTEEAVKNRPGLFCSNFEVKRKGNTYTAQTLTNLHKIYPEHTFYFIIGADSLYEIEKWYEPEQVMIQAVILVASREYEDADRSMERQIAHLSTQYNADIRILHCSEMDISSAEIRQKIAKGLSVAADLPETVLAYIKNHGLYQEMEDS
ncbi:nicotinate-nucleotide adenylyltransferase [Clostridium sp. E02]|uniref:nicotinate-nucleotide adenylyltransferase n=1 Tax=Clostridium sp. E02 TaxID=2487134 RepID=UPI000F53CC84|nr:nicotinate-nucleotide adenylyltransferase [Clostridium sp. E02]